MECPACGRDFASEQGVRIHHTKTHGRSLPNRTCSDCGSEFYDPKSRLEYCDDCNPNAGSNNGNWRDATEISSCEECGDQFEYYPSDRKGTYCSDCVTDSDGLLPENPAEPIDRVVTDCPACGSEHSVLASRLARRERGIFCDLDCYGNWLSENIVGERHHQWNGSEPSYAHGWTRVREAALARDDHQCRVCGRTKEELEQNPDVHHITPIRNFERIEDAHTLDNVISLCRPCHVKAEAGTISLPDPERE